MMDAVTTQHTTETAQSMISSGLGYGRLSIVDLYVCHFCLSL